MNQDKRNLIIGTLVTLGLSSLLSLIPLWQLIFLAGIVGGFINRKILYGALSGAIGVGIFWILYIIDGVFYKGLFNLFDIFGALIIGSGMGWIILLLIILLGFVFGFLGGSLGSSGGNLFLYYYNKQSSSERK